ncbi:GNAT family N-acetyltransferase [Chromobacterium sp. IIBBL 290-4]|uniref:GNAT family N-acetyltransferase n=1 Tax=Chromobacterium sp. IIBBL 290-4 TaxID=2953890 RepID=UPI0020B718A0|nr:GNAT family N-acetyltransferase [Chromobacterium sp. IIBBL 290-4]UTH72719.1 GNAT family N-acetyltransferase [Chromobacterium sp. IIBBL 290-4]
MKIESASEQHLEAYRAYFDACRKEGLKYYQDLGDDADHWLRQLVLHAEGKSLPAGWVPCQSWFLLTGGGEIVGSIRLRLGETAVIQDEIGHVGYEVLPQWRGHGFGKVLLQYVQSLGNVPVCGNWVLVCDATNIASIRTIEACGGQRLEDMPQPDGTVLRRFSLTSLAGIIE